MKKNINYIPFFFIPVILILTGCKKEFFNRPPESALTLDNFYQNTDQVRSSTNALYNSPWFHWNNQASWAITELYGGNARTYSSDVVNFGKFAVTGDNIVLADGWRSLFTVVAQSNALINNLKNKVPASVPANVVNNALGEAHLMRALAYFYLVRVWGNVPIIENSLDYVDNFQVNTNPVSDVYKFIVNDLKFAEANCTAMVRSGSSQAQGHVSSGSATALLAKVYLYMGDHANAKICAEKVINSGEFKLYGSDVQGKSYNDLFKTANNNNEESVIAIQWLGGGSYGHGNSLQSSFAYNSSITGTGDGYAVIGPSIDLQQAYEPGDQRVAATIMLAGAKYPELDQANGGYTVPSDVNAQDTRAAIKKYVVGTPADNGGLGAQFSAGNNTYLMRYSDVLLIEAEAVLAGRTTTSDPAALTPFNKVRLRAGLNALPAITQADILHERRVEFAIEGDYWFDLYRMDGWNGILNNQHPKAIAVISGQERGIYSADKPPVTYSQKYTPTNANFVFPYPATEVAQNSKLTQAPIPYVFN
ncbi:RagB/SusD family nutrient uptake outer membrane protein [Mucilaginibacter daejeonensis]|uniref:RagB/SusD family nutrient uptake outer membrane protein n=1 Tax=Mucilaginibacter daejeonensis TaxID=398049 RepID=UPI001D1737E4|nr:RagB/SusD family nutrient uptake outer membrane protein [Mucilaginibacter daejeonensis]UEG51905.1 RagB/SusD family nutrient uptake outer membrane protein [Mucilaginibacter daejeonensis]